LFHTPQAQSPTGEELLFIFLCDFGRSPTCRSISLPLNSFSASAFEPAANSFLSGMHNGSDCCSFQAPFDAQWQFVDAGLQKK